MGDEVISEISEGVEEALTPGKSLKGKTEIAGKYILLFTIITSVIISIIYFVTPEMVENFIPSSKSTMIILFSLGLLKSIGLDTSYIVTFASIIFIVHPFWIMLTFNDPNKCMDIIPTCNKSWLYFGKESGEPHDEDKLTFIDYIWDITRWFPPERKTYPNDGCHACKNGKKPYKIDGCGAGVNVKCGNCKDYEEWKSFKELTDSKKVKKLPAIQQKYINKHFNFSNPKGGVAHEDYRLTMKDDTTHGMCIPKALTNKSPYIDYVTGNTCDGYKDCANHAPDYITLKWNNTIDPVYPGQRFHIENTVIPYDITIPDQPYKINKKNVCTSNTIYSNPTNSYYNPIHNFHNPICDMDSIGNCSLQIPIIRRPVFKKKKSIKAFRLGSSCTKNCNEPPCHYVNEEANQFNEDASQKISLNLKNKDLENPPNWIKVLDSIRSNCLSDHRGKCFIRDSICKTTSNRTTISHIPIVVQNKLTIPTLSAGGCKNALLPCGATDKPCNAMDIDVNGNIIHVDGMCKLGSWDSSGEWTDDDSKKIKRCIPIQKKSRGWSNVVMGDVISELK